MFHSHVVYNERLRCFWDTEARRRMRGAARRLKEEFWPEYSFRRAPESGGGGGGGAGSARSGRARGVRVDREVARLVAGGGVREPHRLTGFAMEALRRFGIQTMASQVVVHAGGCATAVDVVGRSAGGGWACVELKCSSDRKYTSACGRMRGALACRHDSLEQQHAVQCGVTRLMFERTYGLRADAFVLRVNTLGVTLRRVPRAPELEAALEAISH